MGRNLLDETMGLIRGSDLSLRRIAKEAGVGQAWLAHMVKGRYQNPGINRVQRVHDYLANRSTE